MRLILPALLLLVLTCLRSAAQQREAALFTKDSVEHQSPKWVLVNGDKPEYASPVPARVPTRRLAQTDCRQ